MRNEHLKAYKDKLEKSVCEYCEKYSADERSAEAITSMLTCLDMVKSHLKEKLTESEMSNWVMKMKHEDGTSGEHWSKEQTSAIADALVVDFSHISPSEWWVAMNMMYSDYCRVGVKFDVDTPQFYGCLAKAFLFDKDGGNPEEKLSAYYWGIVEDAEY